MSERPSAAWVKFGAEVRRLRHQSGMTLEDLSTRISLSPQMIGAMERGIRRTKKDIAEELESIFDTNGVLLRRWFDAVKSGDNPDWHTDVVQAEDEAVEIHFCHPTLIPGVLQTSDYAYAVFADGRPLDSKEEIERLTQLRIARLDSLMSKNAPKITAVVCEGVIRSRIGSKAVMHAQLEYLESLAESGMVRLLVIPSAAAYHGAASGPFSLLRFSDRPPAVYADHAGGGTFIDDTREVQRFTAMLQELLAWALSPDLTLNLLREVRSDYT